MSSKVTFSATMDKKFETSSSFHVKHRVAGKFGYLYFPVHGLGPGPQFVFTTRLGPQFVFTTRLSPQFLFNGPSPQFAFTSPGSQFVFTGPGLQFYDQSGAWVCIYQSCLLNLYLSLRPWPTIYITGPAPEYAFILLLVVVAVVVVIIVVVVVVISLE